MKRTLLKFFLGCCLFPLAAMAGDPGFNGFWRLDTANSSALDGWSGLGLIVRTDGTKVVLHYLTAWRTTHANATYTVDTAAPVEIANFFRIDQRHMAVYALPEEPAHAQAAWLDGGRTLRVEARVPLEISQGRATMRIYDEYRLLEGDQTLVLIELHNTRSEPLVYRFTRTIGVIGGLGK